MGQQLDALAITVGCDFHHGALVPYPLWIPVIIRLSKFFTLFWIPGLWLDRMFLARNY
jgi:hypothetical protein